MKDESPTPLSDRERRLLAEMELALRKESPDFEAVFSGRERGEERRRSVAAWAVVIVGMALLTVGLLSGVVLIGLAGFVVVLHGAHTLSSRVRPGRFAGLIDDLRALYGVDRSDPRE